MHVLQQLLHHNWRAESTSFAFLVTFCCFTVAQIHQSFCVWPWIPSGNIASMYYLLLCASFAIKTMIMGKISVFITKHLAQKRQLSFFHDNQNLSQKWAYLEQFQFYNSAKTMKVLHKTFNYSVVHWVKCLLPVCLLLQPLLSFKQFLLYLFFKLKIFLNNIVGKHQKAYF